MSMHGLSVGGCNGLLDWIGGGMGFGLRRMGAYALVVA
jgi:hypothetical protein